MSFTILIDGDGLIYRCGFATEKTRYCVTTGLTDKPPKYFDSSKEAVLAADTNDFVWTRKEFEPVENAIALIDGTIKKILSFYSSHHEDTRIILSPSVGNFRDKIATFAKYKGNRDGAVRPKHYPELLRHLVVGYGATITNGAEADDGISILASQIPEHVVVSLDKDLDQIPGLHYNWVQEKQYVIDKKEACINLYSQILAGDTTDNIPGIEGIGPVKARKMLQGCTSIYDCWEVVRAAYQDKYGSIDEDGTGLTRALEMARLVYLQRTEGELWQPPIKNS